MPIFTLGTPVESKEPTIDVTVNKEQFLPPGRHKFQLVVEDDSGNRSDPDTVEVIVRDTVKPTAVLDAPAQVQPLQSFRLDGRRSSDVAPGRVVKYEWILVG